ncbi:ATPase [Achromatium sp. WMS2]|nr:ATPase [Achromatium sp. WMS2]
MDDTLQRLLDTELRAEKIAKQSEAELDRIIKEAMASAQADAERFETNIPALYASFVEKAEVRAEQAIADMKRRYDERHVQLRARAEQAEIGVLEAAFSFIIDSTSDSGKTRS